MSSPHPSVVCALERHALKQPDKPAFIFVDEHLDRLVLTRQQVWDYCRKFAAILRRKDLGKGTRICNTLRNSPQRVITELGAITGGAISMNGQLCYADGHDFVFSLNQGKADAVILDPDDTKGAFAILKPKLERYDPDSGEVFCPEVPSLKFILPYSLRRERASTNSFLELLEREKEMVHEDLAPDDVCQYMCTSGSTNIFKLVAFSSHVIMQFGIAFSGVVEAKEDDIYMNNRPFGWLGGYPSIYLVLGTCRVVFDESNGRPANFAERQWKIACQEKCTICFTPPLSLIEFNSAREKSDDENVKNYRMRAIFSGGGPMTKCHMQEALGNLCQRVVVCYASTETGVVCSYAVNDLEDFEDYVVGLPVPGIKVKVVDRNDMEVPVGERGEILIQSTQSALYYVNDTENTSRTFQSSGWIRLGDIGILNSQGQLSVFGRDKFAILKGPVIIYPYTVEALIRQYSGVQDVIVCGVHDAKLNEDLCAMIIKKPSADFSIDDILNHCDKCLINNGTVDARPKHVLFVEKFPESTTGKLDRAQAREQACMMLNLEPKL